MVEPGVVSETIKLNNDSPPPIDWQQICRSMLEKSLPLDSVNTQPGEVLQTSQILLYFSKYFRLNRKIFDCQGHILS